MTLRVFQPILLAVVEIFALTAVAIDGNSGCHAGKPELQEEKPLAFRRRLEEVHEPGLRDLSLKAGADEFAFAEGSAIAYVGEPSPYMKRAIADFVDFMKVSMGLRLVVKEGEGEGEDVRISTGLVAKGYEVEVDAGGVSIRAQDDRQAAQALYHLEDLMGLRRAPFLKLGTEKRSPRFSPRMAHSGWGCDQYPASYLMKLQHTGIDTVVLFIDKAGAVPHSLHVIDGERLDNAGFIKRMSDFGFDVYAYSRVTGFKHPSDPDAPQFFDDLYGGISKGCPGAKGYILVDEKCHFPSKDPRVCQWDPKTRQKVDPKDPRPKPAFFPGYDYLDWVEIVRQFILRYSPNVEIVFWTYAFVWAPPEPCREFIRKLPKEIPVMATFETGLEHKKSNGLESRVEDYSISVAGPGDFFRRQASEAAATGHKVYTMANSAGLAWDFGTIPYNPCPYQWRKRWQAVNEAQRTWNVQGVMECHHYGVWPSFITELEKEAFTEGGMDFDAHIRKIAARDFGEKNVDKALMAWERWSRAITDMPPRFQNQYGPFRMGPAYLFNAFQPELTPADWFGGKNPKFVDSYERGSGKKNFSNEYLKNEIELFDGMITNYFAGADAFREIAASLDGRQREKALRMAYLGEYMGRAVLTARNVREGTLAERAKDRDRANALARAEYANTKAVIELMKRDSRLGWEPTMKYQGGVEACEWKLRRLERLYGIKPGETVTTGEDIMLVGDGGKNNPEYRSDPMPVRPNACYRFSFAARRDLDASGWCMTSGFRGLGVDITEVSTNWAPHRYVLGVGADAKSLPVKFGTWLVKGNYHVRGDWKVEEVVPHYATCGEGELGTGEFVLDGAYRFSSPWSHDCNTHSRPLLSFKRMTFNSGRFDFLSNGEMNWRFGFKGRKLKSGRIGIAREYHRAGKLAVEISADGNAWHTVQVFAGETNMVWSFNVPPTLFPCENIWMRLSADKGGVRLLGLDFTGRLDGAQMAAVGETRYVPVGETCPPFAAETPELVRTASGACLPGSAPYLKLWGESSGSKVARGRKAPSAMAKELSVRMARNEAEAVQLVLTPSEDVSDIAVALDGELSDGKGHVLDSAVVSVLRVGYVEVRLPTSPSNQPGFYPDPLPPQTPGLAVASGESQPFWVRVKPPKDACAGIYRAHLAVKGRRADGTPFACKTPFAVEVFDFTFPDAVTCRTLFGLYTDVIRRYHHLLTGEDCARVYPLYLKAMSDYHLSPYYPALDTVWKVKWKGLKEAKAGDLSKLEPEFDFAAWDAAMADAFSRYHFNAFRVGRELGLGYVNSSRRRNPEIAGFKEGTPAYDIMLEKLLKGLAAHLKEKGWLDKTVVYPFDEPREVDDAFVMNGFAKLKRHAPGMTRLLTSPARKGLIGGPNVWCPMAHDLHAQCAVECRAAGDRFWWYVCTGAKPPYPGIFIDNPGVDMRVWLWQTWNEGLDGVLVWNTDLWTRMTYIYPACDPPQNPYDDAMSWNPNRRPLGNGDGRFFYPPLAAADGLARKPVYDPPVGSIRGEMLRDGIEDYEYFAMLKRLLATNGARLDAEDRKATADLLKVPADVYRSLTDYNRDPAAMESHRMRLARAIEKLSH